MNNWFKKNGIHFGIVLFFLVICFVYLTPAFQGKVLVQNDVQQASAMQREIMAVKDSTGKGPLWTNSMFGGMPSYQIWTNYPKSITSHLIIGYNALFPNPVNLVMLYLLGAYFLFNVLLSNSSLSKTNRIILSVGGALAFAFSSYHFIIIEAGHGNKALAIGFFGPILASILLTLRGQRWLGAGLLALFLSLEIRANHIQMTYYLFLALLILIIIEFYQAFKNKTLPVFGKSFLFLIAGALIGIAVNTSMLWTTYEYGQLSIRGKSNLKAETSAAPVNGLDKEYAYQWSQGVGECLTFLVPNAYGGASAPMLDDKSNVAKALTSRGVDMQQAAGFAQQMPVYWGPKPFTSGPWYFGIIILFLFVYGLFIIKGKLKWWLLAATLLSLFLSFGKNFSLISDLFFDYIPLYNKFRAVESILVIASLCLPILAVLAVAEILKQDADKKFLVDKLKISSIIVGGLLLILWLFPSLLLNFRADNHQDFVGQLSQLTGDASFANSIAQALIEDRTEILKSDALRSILFLAFGIAILWASLNKKISSTIAISAIMLLVIVDLWSVDKRYLNNEGFQPAAVIKQQWQPREVDEFIMRDPDPDYRVLDLTISTFSSANATYFHNTVGGYHAAKLKRFQEVIDKQFTGSLNQDVLDMLNTKYFITTAKDGQNVSMKVNPTASGHAWFVDKVQFVQDNDQEMAAISSFNPKEEAIVNDEFKAQIDMKNTGTSAGGKIELTNYHPDHLTYAYSAPKDAIAVFSEIWYPKGWNLYIDGEKQPYFRANYILRAAQLPGGNHTLEWKFEPKSYYFGENISLIASILLSLVLAFAIYKER